MHTNTLATVVYWISRAQITTTRLTCFCFSSAVWGHIGAHSNKHNTWPMGNISDRVMQISIENIKQICSITTGIVGIFPILPPTSACPSKPNLFCFCGFGILRRNECRVVGHGRCWFSCLGIGVMNHQTVLVKNHQLAGPDCVHEEYFRSHTGAYRW